MNDFTRAVTMELKGAGNYLYLIGKRKDELGGSVYYQTLGFVGRNVPNPDLAKERKNIQKIIDLISEGVILSCHDISDGGLISAIIEMAIKGGLGAEFMIAGEMRPDKFLFSETEANLDSELMIPEKMRMDKFLFSETGGFILEVRPEDSQRIEEGLDEAYLIGKVTEEPRLLIESLVEIPLEPLKNRYEGILKELLV